MKQVHKIKRRISSQIFVGDVAIGGGAPISVQSMTNTNTCDIESTILQIESLEKAGADIVRVSIPTMDAAEAFKEIKKRANIPLITDIHFNYKIALKVAEYGADCLRINPGNIGKEDRVREVVASAKDHNIPIRIGVNAGSLEKDLQNQQRTEKKILKDRESFTKIGKSTSQVAKSQILLIHPLLLNKIQPCKLNHLLEVYGYPCQILSRLLLCVILIHPCLSLGIPKPIENDQFQMDILPPILHKWFRHL